MSKDFFSVQEFPNHEVQQFVLDKYFNTQTLWLNTDKYCKNQNITKNIVVKGIGGFYEQANNDFREKIRRFNNSIIYLTVAIFRFVNYYFLCEKCDDEETKTCLSIWCRYEARCVCNETFMYQEKLKSILRNFFGLDIKKTKTYSVFIKELKKFEKDNISITEFCNESNKYYNDTIVAFINDIRNNEIHNDSLLDEFNDKIDVGNGMIIYTKPFYNIETKQLYDNIKDCLEKLLSLKTTVQNIIDNVIKGQWKTMIPNYIKQWLKIIDEMHNDNTYKLAFGRALIETITFEQYEIQDNNVVIDFDNISKCMLKYYWNQLFYFNLKQAPYTNKEPVICKDTKILIELYKSNSKTTIPKWYDEAIGEIKKHNLDTYNKIIKHITKTLHENVCWRFKIANDSPIDIYEYTPKISKIIFDRENALLLKEYAVIISKLLNYKWTQLLEKFNFAPKIASKVNGISETKLRRNSLKKFKDALLMENGGKAIDFYSGIELEENDISIDHVIPWSFMYSDDIWNLVITSKSNNSSKSNSIPDEKVIEKLKNRNLKLVQILSGSFKADLELSIKSNYLDRFYYECKL